ncbi:MAG: hypothetical protein KAI63_06395, partial [Planctomycetes bacterium]|nr:hypothetical protein [Planctomycetota bacterium]
IFMIVDINEVKPRCLPKCYHFIENLFIDYNNFNSIASDVAATFTVAFYNWRGQASQLQGF